MIFNPSIIGDKEISAQDTSYDNTATSSIITSDNVQGAIDQLFTSVSNGKALIASAITDKGVSTSASGTFQQMAENINKIETSGYVSSIEINQLGDGNAQVYDCEKRQWVDLSSAYTTVKVPNFIIMHKGNDTYTTSNIIADELGSVNFFNISNGAVNYLIISQIDYPKGFSGLKNTEVTLFYNEV